MAVDVLEVGRGCAPLDFFDDVEGAVDDELVFVPLGVVEAGDAVAVGAFGRPEFGFEEGVVLGAEDDEVEGHCGVEIGLRLALEMKSSFRRFAGLDRSEIFCDLRKRERKDSSIAQCLARFDPLSVYSVVCYGNLFVSS